MSLGRVFQKVEAATENERRPTVDRRYGGTSSCCVLGMFLLSLLNQATSAVAKPIATAMVATDRMAATAHIDPSYSQGDDNVHRHLI